MDFQLADLTAVVRSWGRGVIMRAAKWDTTSPLVMAHLGDTEGDMNVQTNPEIAGLTLPELTGPAVHEYDYTGENPVIEVPLYVTDPAMHALISPSGSAHAGRDRRGVVVEHTIAVFPENLWVDPLTGRVDRDLLLSFAGGAWTFDGAPLSAAKLELLDSTFWLWRCVFDRPARRFRGGAGDDKKNIETVSIRGMHYGLMPDGHKLYTTGDPYTATPSINLEGMS